MGGEAITGLKLNAFSELRRGWHEERGNGLSVPSCMGAPGALQRAEWPLEPQQVPAW